jgi:uncharacterized flavoprotein (TIGR03862 family)
MAAGSEVTRVAIVGGGPAGLMAAEAARARGASVDLYEGKGSVGRKLLIAGRGGLNLTHGEPYDAFVTRYGARSPVIDGLLRDFGADRLRAWAAELGVDTFVGSSGRVFPSDMKAAPLLRAWVHRLREQGVRFHARHRLVGLRRESSHDGWALQFDVDGTMVEATADAVVLALGGASWPQLGSDGAWVGLVRALGVDVAPLVPANCGFDVAWTPFFADKFAGAPIKSVVATAPGAAPQQGEFVITKDGIEGQLIYALSAPLRDAIAQEGSTTLTLDLMPGWTRDRIAKALATPRGGRSRSEVWRRRIHLEGVKAALLHEVLPREQLDDATTVASTIKALPLRLERTRPIAEAISTAGGVRFESLDANLMSKAATGLYFAGEMLDWEAPTGGYLLTASFASGLRAGAAAAERPR